MLPVQGASDEADFVFTPRLAAPFQGRITVLFHGRVLQTSLVLASVTEAGTPENQALRIDRRIEARVRNSWSDLDSRRTFDMAIVLNHIRRPAPNAYRTVGQTGLGKRPERNRCPRGGNQR